MWKVDKLIVSNYPFTYCRLQIGMVERIKSLWLFKQASAFIIELKHHIYIGNKTRRKSKVPKQAQQNQTRRTQRPAGQKILV